MLVKSYNFSFSFSACSKVYDVGIFNHLNFFHKKYYELWYCKWLSHWGRATHICVSKLTFIASDDGSAPGRRQAIIWNNAGMLSIGLLGTSFSEILIEILTFSFKKMCLKVSSAKWRPFCLGLNVLSTAWIPAYYWSQCLLNGDGIPSIDWMIIKNIFLECCLYLWLCY